MAASLIFGEVHVIKPQQEAGAPGLQNAAAAEGESPRPGVLLVDDRPEKVLALEAALADLPLRLVRAYSGREALRQLLQQEFAVILLDVNMPGMDGFETASLIRQRKSCEHTPIIFITALHDDMMVTRGYKLGAVDYIAQPVLPDVLRTKVQVFVELYRKNRQLAAQAEQQRRRADQQQKLAAASTAINASLSMEKMLQITTDAARDIVGTQQAITLFIIDSGDGQQAPQAEAIASFSDKYAEWRGRRLELDVCAHSLVVRSRNATRLTNAQLQAHPDWQMVRQLQIPPIQGVLAAPLRGRDGRHLGVIYLSDKIDGEFSEHDEALLVQLAQMTAVAIENALSAEAREANRAKDQFLAVLSHELRTPLTPVLAVLQQIQRDRRMPPDVLEEVGMARRNVELEARLIDDLLDLTRISKGKIELSLDTIDAHGLVNETVMICRPDIAAKNIELELALEATASYVQADLTRLQQVFWNILKNAVKFTPPAGKISIRSRNTPEGEIQLSFADSGIGIDPDALPRIFQPFEQGKRNITRRFGGLGLGLTISKALVELHHGQLAAQSEGKDRGATFIVTLPTAAVDRSRREPPQLRLAAASPERMLKILLVEDHPDTARIMAKLLTGLRHEVHLAHSVTQALQMATSIPFDLLISDIGLPDASGLDLMRQLQARRPIVGIALSGFGMEEDIRRSKEAGFSEHLTKPLDFTVLLQAIDRASVAMAQAEATPLVG